MKSTQPCVCFIVSFSVSEFSRAYKWLAEYKSPVISEILTSSLHTVPQIQSQQNTEGQSPTLNQKRMAGTGMKTSHLEVRKLLQAYWPLTPRLKGQGVSPGAVPLTANTHAASLTAQRRVTVVAPSIGQRATARRNTGLPITQNPARQRQTE